MAVGTWNLFQTIIIKLSVCLWTIYLTSTVVPSRRNISTFPGGLASFIIFYFLNRLQPPGGLRICI